MATELKCPNCDNTENFTYIEDACLYRRVRGIDKNGMIEINGEWETSDGDSPRIECDECFEIVDIPLSKDIKWI